MAETRSSRQIARLFKAAVTVANCGKGSPSDSQKSTVSHFQAKTPSGRCKSHGSNVSVEVSRIKVELVRVQVAVEDIARRGGQMEDVFSAWIPKADFFLNDSN